MKTRTCIALLFLASASAHAQGRPATAMQDALRLDLAGATSKARVVIQSIIDTIRPARRKGGRAGDAVAMSHASFDGDCNNTVKFERMVMAYWNTRESAEPQNAFYQEGEMANEAARVCIDAAALDTADVYYRLGTALGMKEPMPDTHPRSLWEFRQAHALGRLAARRGNRAEAERQIGIARKVLDSDSTMRSQQERFYPYLVGYVALYTNDIPTAVRELATPCVRECARVCVCACVCGNENDPFMRLLLGMAYEKTGRSADAKEAYDKALSLATAHNPPSAYVHHYLATRHP